MRTINIDTTKKYENYLIEEEKSQATIEKYVRDVTAFYQWLERREVDKRVVMDYKERLTENYKPRSVNSVLSSINSLFSFLGWIDCKVKTLKIQRQIFADKDKELTRDEYDRLLEAAMSEGNERLYYLMQTICATGIRVSEDIYCKG